MAFDPETLSFDLLCRNSSLAGEYEIKMVGWVEGCSNCFQTASFFITMVENPDEFEQLIIPTNFPPLFENPLEVKQYLLIGDAWSYRLPNIID